MENDDKLIGQILSRRDALKLLGIGSAAFLVSCAAPDITGTIDPTSIATLISKTQDPPLTVAALDCVVRPELTIGPYFVDGQLERSDIRTEPSNNSIEAGTPLSLRINVTNVGSNSCTPIQGAKVDIWHCDASGEYSGVSDRGFDTSGQKFLRGYQLTDAGGAVQFLTIYPGWYSGRAVHIHFTIRTKGADENDYQFTSQFFFDDSLTDQVHALEPYAAKRQRDIRNNADNIYNAGGEQLLLDLQGDTTNGYSATMTIGLDLANAAVGAADSMGQGGGGPPPGP
jgi:protocatechuate 3,4-dioxygenase beta subunit